MKEDNGEYTNPQLVKCNNGDINNRYNIDLMYGTAPFTKEWMRWNDTSTFVFYCRVA